MPGNSLKIRIFQMVALALVLAFAAPAAAEGEKAVFKAAYKAYQAAVDAKDVKAAVDAAREALDRGKSIYDDDSPSLAALHVNYGMALVDARHPVDAVKPLNIGIRKYEKLYGKEDSRLISPLISLSDAYGGRSSQEKKQYYALSRALGIVVANEGKNSAKFAEVSILLGEFTYNSRYYVQYARGHFRRAYETYKNYYNEPHYNTGLAVFWMGKAARQALRNSQAEDYYLEALDLFEKTTPAGHESQLMAHTFLIKFYENRGETDEATLHCQAISRLRPLAGVDGFEPLYMKSPIYPRGARTARRTGHVVVNFSVTTLGTVANATVVESKGGKRGEFERAALKAIEGFRYAPAVKDGVLVETTNVRNKIVFEIGKY